MNECNMELTMKKKGNYKIGRRIIKICSIIISIILMLLCLLIFIMEKSFGEIFTPLLFAIMLYKFGKSKYEEYKYSYIAGIDNVSININESNNIVFEIKNFKDEKNEIYDLKIIFPSDRIEDMYLDENSNEKEIVGGNIGGYPVLYQSNKTTEPIDCIKNKEEVFIIYEFKNNKELINKLEEIKKNTL